MKDFKLIIARLKKQHAQEVKELKAELAACQEDKYQLHKRIADLVYEMDRLEQLDEQNKELIAVMTKGK